MNQYTSFAWPDEAIDQLKKLRADGVSSSLIGATLGISRNAVIGKASRLGLPVASSITRYRPSSRKVRADYDRRLTQVFRKKPSFAPVEPVIIEEPVAPPEFLGIGLLDLNRDDCRYPRGEGSEVTFCGQPQLERSSYCWHCHGLAYRRTV